MTDFSVKTQAAAYQDGYQSAMHDIQTALKEGGEEAVREWVANNTLQLSM